MNDRKPSNDPMSQRIISALNHEAENLPPGRIREIRAIREQALQKHKPGATFFPHLVAEKPNMTRKWHTGLAFATAVLAIFVIFLVSTPQQESPLLTADNAFNEQAMTADEIEFYEQLDFYLWLQDVSENHEQLS